jgi:hypothetical protein
LPPTNQQNTPSSIRLKYTVNPTVILLAVNASPEIAIPLSRSNESTATVGAEDHQQNR